MTKKIRLWLNQIDIFELSREDGECMLRILGEFAEHHMLALTDAERIYIFEKHMPSEVYDPELNN